MKIAILGAGAIGGSIGGYLTRAGSDVTLIDPWEANIDRIRSKGLTVTALEEEFTVRPMALLLSDVSKIDDAFDTAILAVKSYDTANTARKIQPHLTPDGFIVSAQNGINEEEIAEVVGWPRVMGCIVLLGAAMYKPGHVTRTTSASLNTFKLGEPSGEITPRLEKMVEIMGAAGPAEASTNLIGERWAKLGTNCISNAVAGITGMSSGQLRANPLTRELAMRIGSELIRVAEALGIQPEPIWSIPSEMLIHALEDDRTREEVEERMIEAGKVFGAGIPSLAQDLMKARKTEVEFLNGYVVKKGKEAGIPTPINEAIVAVTRRVEEGELKPSLANLKYLRG